MIISTLKHEGYKLIAKEGQNVILENDEGGVEVWTEYDNESNTIFVFKIGKLWYMFARAM